MIRVLSRSTLVHLKENGEICNRLKAGTSVHILRKKGDWLKITWRNGRKKGWILDLDRDHDRPSR